MALDFFELRREMLMEERAKRSRPDSVSVSQARAEPLQLPETCPLRKEKARVSPQRLDGLDVWYAPEFIDEDEENSLLSTLDPDESWVRVRGRSLLRFGGPAGSADFVLEPLPLFVASVADAASGFVGVCLNHCLVNSYAPGEGIMAHTDGPAYDHVTATLSCGQDRLVYFAKRLRPAQVGTPLDTGPVASVLLRRRSLLVFKNDAYIHHTHEIEPTKLEVVGTKAPCINLRLAEAHEGDQIPVVARRLSFTLRRAKAD
ncbi:hypothetical protein CTAYLR_001893 [Chrysophaeum taylorii]|uniref:Fe2OG dioxygenase domain-containing protein n=1 Tax=Chrysophaeum taylorii TaxID=2483200 RepID=A0AAD7U8H1_9STRA|nr:hypothetical protein CTAYLR_001893 [Chrysophaeum taylorii]